MPSEGRQQQESIPPLPFFLLASVVFFAMLAVQLALSVVCFDAFHKGVVLFVFREIVPSVLSGCGYRCQGTSPRLDCIICFPLIPCVPSHSIGYSS